MKERILDLIFLIGVLFKGIDGLAELVGGIALLVVTPAKLVSAAEDLTASELAEDPHNVLANLVLNGVIHLGTGGKTFLAAYLLLHGVVKLAIVVALLIGSRKVYPWAMAALGLFLIFQVYEMVTQPSVGVAILTVFDAVIIWLTWREWRRGRELRETWRGTVAWVFHRAPRARTD